MIRDQDQLVYQPSTPSLRDRAHSVAIGAAVAAEPLRCEPAYAQALGHEFNFLTTEDALKFGPVHPQPNRYAWDDADAIVAFAEVHDMQVRGHTLVWHQQLAGWVQDKAWSRDELLLVLQEHIAAVVGRYRGRVDVWDVINEAVDDDGSLRKTVWLNAIGPEYLDLAFRWAHQADPDARLFYNDYNGEEMNHKADAIYELVKGMVERGVPIHGVGLQMHITAEGGLRWPQVQQNMQRLNELGLEVHITELDVRIAGTPTADKLARQAEVYRAAMATCLAAPRCTALVMWGFTDRHSWIPALFGGQGAALPFDDLYRPKPAYSALAEALGGP